MKRGPQLFAGAIAILIPMLVSGCVSKAKADAQARTAFLAGQQQALQQMQVRGPSVTVLGEVRNKLIPWTADLTLAKAVLAAEYYGAKDPTEIIIVRDGEQIPVEASRLLSGEDIPLQPRDIIALNSGP